MDRIVRLILVVGFAAGLLSCTALPRSGPDDGVIEMQAAAVNPTDPDEKTALNYALVDLSKIVLDFVTDPGPGSLYRTFGLGRGAPAEIRIGTGDVVQVTIFESSAGGLFIPSEAGSRAGNFVTIPSQTVDRAGFISVPYAGLVQAKGRTLAEIGREIEQKLANRAIEPQAVVSLVTQRANEMALVGDVNAPDKIAISPAGDRVIDIISRGGGIRFPGWQTFVTLVRGGRKATVFFSSLLANPNENVYVQAGDTVYVYREQRWFIAVGASGLNGRFDFDSERVMLADAVGKAGGLLDGRADPRQVFIYRLEDRHALENMGVNLSRFDPARKRIPTIFRTNFRDPASFFLAQRFPMRDRDVLYVSNSDSTELFKFLTLVDAISSTTAGVAEDAATTKSSLQFLFNQ